MDCSWNYLVRRGDTIYTIQTAPIMHIEVVESIKIYSNKIKFITKDRFNGGFWYYYLEEFGEIAFTTKAEAEAKLRELEFNKRIDCGNATIIDD